MIFVALVLTINTNLAFEQLHKISNNVVCATSKASNQPVHTRILIRAFASRLNKLLTEHHLEFLSYKGGCTKLSESTIVKMPHCGKSHVTANFISIKHLKIICQKHKVVSLLLPSMCIPNYMKTCQFLYANFTDV